MNLILLLPLLFINSFTCCPAIEKCGEPEPEPVSAKVVDEVNFFTPFIFLNN